MMNLWQVILANVAVFIGAFIQSGTGFGLGLIAVPLLTLADPAFTPGGFLFCSLFQNMVMAVRNRPGIRTDWLVYFFPGLFLGALLVYPIIGNLKGAGAEIAIGTTILLSVVRIQQTTDHASTILKDLAGSVVEIQDNISRVASA